MQETVQTPCQFGVESRTVTRKGPGKPGLMMFLGLRKLGNICGGHKMFLNKIRNIFWVPDTKFVSATNVARSGKRGNVCVCNNVSSFAMALTPVTAEYA